MATPLELAARKVRGVVTRDTKRSLDPLLNAARFPMALTALCISESSLDEHSERYQPNCDKSAGLVHRSVCYVPDSIAQRIPGFDHATKDTEGRYLASLSNYEALRRYYWVAENALDDARPRIDALMDRYQHPVEAVARWNKPSIPAAQNPNYPHIVESWNAAQQYIATEEPMSTATLLVGQGIRDVMSRANDHPIRDSEFFTNKDGSQMEKGFGLKGIYVASNATGGWESAGPLAVGL